MIYCNFPLICGINRGVCCESCDKKENCKFVCSLSSVDCDNSGDKSIFDDEEN